MLKIFSSKISTILSNHRDSSPQKSNVTEGGKLGDELSQQQD